MKNIKLGLDIGTNSIGWAILEKSDSKYDFLEKLDKNGNLIPTKGSYIFTKGTDASEKSLAATRRQFRGARRRINRIRLRKIATLKVLNKFDLCPPFETNELQKWKNKKIYPCENDTFIEWQRTGKRDGNSEIEKLKQPYYLRYFAATKSGLMDSKEGRWKLGRAFYHLTQRRGYLSNGEDEQTDDKLETYKMQVRNLLESSDKYVSFIESYKVFYELCPKDDKLKKLGKKVEKIIDLELKNPDSPFERIQNSILEEFDKKENLGKVEGGIKSLTDDIKTSGEPTLGCYFYKIYNTKNEKGLIRKIRGVYIHRNEHYEKEFNYICDKQNISGELRKELHHAIFYQRPLKSQKSLVANCPYDKDRKRIAISHPLFEKFRMWESINRIKIKRSVIEEFETLTQEEKNSIVKLFERVSDFEFNDIAKELSQEKSYNYSKKPEDVYINGKPDKEKELKAEVQFNFAMDKSFSGSPTLGRIKKILGKDRFYNTPFLNTSHIQEKGKSIFSIEDIWNCLFQNATETKSKSDIRKAFAKKRLQLNDEQIDDFAKIKIKQGYGSLSKSAIKKILPYLELGFIYSHAVFLANVDKVLGRPITQSEKQLISELIKSVINEHNRDKTINGIVNNYLSIYKEQKEGFSNEPILIKTHKAGLEVELFNWIGEKTHSKLTQEEIKIIIDQCWIKFVNAVEDVMKPKDIEYIKNETIENKIIQSIISKFPNDKINSESLYHPSAMEVYPHAINGKLGSPKISSIKNPVFDRAMHQIKNLITELITKGLVNNETIVNIEVAGEINSASYRKALSLWQKDQEDIRNWVEKNIKRLFLEECKKEITVTSEAITKYQLWMEQGNKCIYTGETISICDFLNENPKYDIEHTVPRSKINNNSLTNKTLANGDFNRNYKQATLPGLLEIKYNETVINRDSLIRNMDCIKSYTIKVVNKEKLPSWNIGYTSLLNDYKKFKNAAKNITDATAHDEIMTKVHYTKMKLDYLAEKRNSFLTTEITTKFTNANLVDTRIITKYARAYLNSYFDKVYVVNGKITDTLRKMWGLQDEYEIKDRGNHIHHCIDAITVACTELGTRNKISEAFHQYERDYFETGKGRIHLSEPMKDFVARMKNLENEVLIFHKQRDKIKPLIDEAEKANPKKLNLRGALNSANPYGIRKDENNKIFFVQRTPIKKISSGDFEDIVDERVRKRLKIYLENNGDDLSKLLINDAIILPPYKDFNKAGKEVESGQMLIKSLRMRSRKDKLKPYKEYRKTDWSKKDYKREIYFDKETGSNYEARIYGDLLPNEKGKLNREYELINTFNIVKKIKEKESKLPLLFSMHRDDYFILFNLHIDEINWNDKKDLQIRLFKIVKFSEKGVIVLERHNYADGDVDHANGIKSESNLNNKDEVVLRRSPSTLKAIPTKINPLGEIDIEYSKDFILNHI